MVQGHPKGASASSAVFLEPRHGFSVFVVGAVTSKGVGQRLVVIPMLTPVSSTVDTETQSAVALTLPHSHRNKHPSEGPLDFMSFELNLRVYEG